MNDAAHTYAMFIPFLVRAARRPCDAAAFGFRIHPPKGAMIGIMGHIPLLFVLSVSGAAAKYDNCIKGNKDTIGDFRCNNENNNEECAYGGGDC